MNTVCVGVSTNVFVQAVLHGVDIDCETKRKTEAFIRLLSYYQIYIGKITNIFEPSLEEQLAAKHYFRWDNDKAYVSHDADYATDKGPPRQIRPSEKNPLDIMAFDQNPSCDITRYLSNLSGICNDSQMLLDGPIPDYTVFDAPLNESDLSLLHPSQDVLSAFQGFTAAPHDNSLWKSTTSLKDNSFCAFREPDAGTCLNPMTRLINGETYTALDDTGSSSYWTFFSQSEPFQIYNTFTKIRYVNKPDQSDRSNSGTSSRTVRCRVCNVGISGTDNIHLPRSKHENTEFDRSMGCSCNHSFGGGSGCPTCQEGFLWARHVTVHGRFSESENCGWRNYRHGAYVQD